MRIEYVEFKNIIIKDDAKYIINDYFIFEKAKVGSVLICQNPSNGIPESSESLLFSSLKLSLPEIEIYPLSKGENKYSTWHDRDVIINYFDSSNDTIGEHLTINLNIDIIEYMKKIFEIYVKHNQNQIAARDNKWARMNYWNVAVTAYLSYYHSMSVDKAIAELIMALECLISNGSTEITYRTSLYTAILYTDDYELRKKVFSFVKDMYNIRSKVVHGDLLSIKNTFKNRNLEKDLMFLKTIVSNILIKTFDISKETILNKIEESIYLCPPIKIDNL